jgi:probable phosphoglycerate mutase
MSCLPFSTPRESSGGSHGTIYLLRHGAICSAKQARCYVGWQNVALSKAGIRQAENWARYFSGLALDEIYCSDLTRCLETAKIIGSRCTLKPKPLYGLREIFLGAWEGRRFQSIQALYPREFQNRGDRIADHRPAGGESFRDLQARVWPEFEAIARRLSGHILMVTHAGVIRVLLCRLLGMPLENLFLIGQAHGALNIIGLRSGHWRIEAMNLPYIPNH